MILVLIKRYTSRWKLLRPQFLQRTYIRPSFYVYLKHCLCLPQGSMLSTWRSIPHPAQTVYIPCENNLSSDLFGDAFLEVRRTTAGVVHVVHGIKYRLEMQNLVTHVSNQHRTVLKLQDRCHESWPYLQSAHSSFHTYFNIYANKIPFFIKHAQK